MKIFIDICSAAGLYNFYKNQESKKNYIISIEWNMYSNYRIVAFIKMS